MRIALVTLTLLFSPVQADDSEAVSYCHDPEASQQSGGLIKEMPGDDILMRLFALRLGLCQFVDSGQLGLDRATEIFEQARRGAAMERRQEEEHDKQQWRGEAQT